MFEAFTYYIRFSGSSVMLFFIPLSVLYAIWKVLQISINYFLYKKQDALKSLESFGGAFIFFYATLASYFFIIGYCLEYITTNVSPRTIAHFDAQFMSIDKFIFGSYLPFWFQDSSNTLKSLFDISSIFIIFIYTALSYVVSGVLIFLIIKDPKRFSQMVIAFALSMILSLPFWYVLPALSPLEGFVDNLPNASISRDIQDTLTAYTPNETLKHYFARVRSFRQNTKDNFYAITTFPSMHIAWSVIALFFGAIAWRPLALLLAPYLALNMLATIYTLQHYAIDIPAGLLVGLTSIAITCHTIRKPLWVIDTITHCIREDIRGFKRLLLSPRQVR